MYVLFFNHFCRHLYIKEDYSLQWYSTQQFESVTIKQWTSGKGNVNCGKDIPVVCRRALAFVCLLDLWYLLFSSLTFLCIVIRHTLDWSTKKQQYEQIHWLSVTKDSGLKRDVRIKTSHMFYTRISLDIQ